MYQTFVQVKISSESVVSSSGMRDDLLGTSKARTLNVRYDVRYGPIWYDVRFGPICSLIWWKDYNHLFFSLSDYSQRENCWKSVQYLGWSVTLVRATWLGFHLQIRLMCNQSNCCPAWESQQWMLECSIDFARCQMTSVCYLFYNFWKVITLLTVNMVVGFLGCCLNVSHMKLWLII